MRVVTCAVLLGLGMSAGFPAAAAPGMRVGITIVDSCSFPSAAELSPTAADGPRGASCISHSPWRVDRSDDRRAAADDTREARLEETHLLRGSAPRVIVRYIF